MPPMACNRCFFWVSSGGAVSGECRRPLPVMAGLLAGQAGDPRAGVFPVTGSGTWCRGFQDLESEWSRQMMRTVGRQ